MSIPEVTTSHPPKLKVGVMLETVKSAIDIDVDAAQNSEDRQPDPRVGDLGRNFMAPIFCTVEMLPNNQQFFGGIFSNLRVGKARLATA
ncbi:MULTISPECIES: hypothetical protein [unclassified Bradyrhizobium]|uniref:hypothetical protein n=1 Tax=unclassified Bradyrhizobium TaxID=2631580 RepID=UPI0028E8AC64|nr:MULTISPECIES: hypothetical protein [unclassified Bradyrhizobium]